MNKMLKTLGLFLLVSTVSFTFAQDEDGKESKVGKSTVNDATKKGSEVDVNAGMTAKAKPTVEKLASHEQCPECGKTVAKDKGKSIWQKLFPSRKDKAKKEKDPN